MVLKNGDPDRTGEQNNRGFVASLFRSEDIHVLFSSSNSALCVFNVKALDQMRLLNLDTPCYHFSHFLTYFSSFTRRRKTNDRRPPANSHPGYGHPFTSSRQHETLGTGGRWAGAGGRKQGEAVDRIITVNIYLRYALTLNEHNLARICFS